MLRGSDTLPCAGAVAEPVAIRSVGCRTNQGEMQVLRGELERRGITVTDKAEHAAVIVVNTCSVTSLAESKTRRLLSALRREAPRARILLTGCLAQQEGRSLLGLKHVSWVVGNAAKDEIPEILRRGQEGFFGGDVTMRPLSAPPPPGPPAPGGRTRFLLKIQEGCDRACSYCIVPSLRGPSRSVPAAAVVETCRAAIDQGYKEIVLTGTHIGQFGRGELLSLVATLLGIGGDFRLRLSSLDPNELSGELLAVVGEGGRMCDHLHVSLQSLSPAVLAMMARPVREGEVLLERLADFRRKYPMAGLGADFIVGFPGETDAMFEETLARVAESGFSYGHVFRYSARPGTAAPAMPGKVPEQVKTGRSERLRAALAAGRERFIAGLRGVRHRIIVEREKPVRGVTANYLQVEVSEHSALHNSWLDVIIEGTSGGRYCRAHPLPQGTV